MARIVKNELYKAIPIFLSGLTDSEIKNFAVKHKEGQGLVNYLYGLAQLEEEKNLMRTYVVRDVETNEFVGYFSLKAGMISIDEKRINDFISFETRPAVELANFAVNYTYLLNHDDMVGCGISIFDTLIIPIIEEVSKKIGINLIYIYSLPVNKLVSRYKKYGFKRLSLERENELHKRLKPIYDKGCIFMYQEI